MIRLTWADIGTKPHRERPSRNPPHPFMDLGWWAQVREYEHYFYEHNRTMPLLNDLGWSTLEGYEINPWPERFNGHMWIDRTDRHETIEGWYLDVYGKDEQTGGYYEMPRCPHLWLDMTYEPPEINPQECVTKPLKHHNPDDAANLNPLDLDPTTLTRLPFKNEDEAQVGDRFRAYCHLKEPILADIIGHDGASVVLSIPNDCLLFAPFDFRHPEWYRCFDVDGKQLLNTEEWLALRPDMEYVIHLRPRWWRVTVFVLAHYAYVSLWGFELNDEFFVHVFFDRPPVYPYRHDVIHSKQEQGSENWNGDMRSYDIGIDYWWEQTTAAANLAREILDQQYSWYCVVYMFLSNENPDLFFEAYPPRREELVCIIEHVDKVTGSTTPVFVRQHVGLDSIYPHYNWGAFLANWQVVPEPGRWRNPGSD